MGLIVIWRDGHIVGKTELAEHPLFIGRQEDASLRLADPAVSRQHAVVVEKNGVAGIKDLGSSNGTFVNGSKLESTSRLVSGDEVCIGPFRLKYYDSMASLIAQNKQSREASIPTPPSGVAAINAQSSRLAAVEASKTVPPPPPPPLPSKINDLEAPTIAFKRPEMPVSAPPTTPYVAAAPTPAAAAAPAPFMEHAPPPTPPAAAKEETPAAGISFESFASAKPIERKSAFSPPSTKVDKVADEDTVDGEDELDGETVITSDEAAEKGMVVGEFEAAPEEEDIDISARACQSALLEVPPDLQALIESRLAVLATLDELEGQRKEMLAGEDLPEDVKGELRRQQREAQLLPNAIQAKASLSKTREKIAALEGKIADGQAEKPSPLQIAARNLAIKQWEILINRDELLPALLDEAVKIALAEPLYRILSCESPNIRTLFGWTIFSLALEANMANTAERRQSTRERLAAAEQPQQGMLSFLKRDNGAENAREGLRREESEQLLRSQRLARENAAAEKTMIELFWKTYEDAALLLAKNTVKPEDEPALRGFLRYGLLGQSPCFIDPDICAKLLEECATPEREWKLSMSANHVLYADEYLHFAYRGLITPSINEDLELNHRHSPEWKADKGWRRLISGRVRIAVLEELLKELEEKAFHLRTQQEAMERAKAALPRSERDYKKKILEIAQRAQHFRVEAARFQRAVERIKERYLPQQQESVKDTEQRLATGEAKMTPEIIAKQEASAIHRVCRLCANLKEAYPPFTLRDHYRPDTDAVNGRESMNDEFRRIEEADPTIFKDPLMQVKKRSHRIFMRFFPVTLLAPTCGFMGYAWNPRTGVEIGRLAMPAYSPRPGIRERILHPLLADFRWDTSKATAGMDILTSDTIVAAYATMRWEYRKSAKHIREKAAIYTDENDRKNFRRHYSLYISSAVEGGKKLFFKCFEAYEALYKYIDLPEGVERLRR